MACTLFAMTALKCPVRFCIIGPHAVRVALVIRLARVHGSINFLDDDPREGEEANFTASSYMWFFLIQLCAYPFVYLMLHIYSAGRRFGYEEDVSKYLPTDGF